MESNKSDMIKLIYKTKTDSQILKSNLWSPRGKDGGKGEVRRLGLMCTHYHT